MVTYSKHRLLPRCFVLSRANCETFVSIDVFKSLHQLGNLTPHKYDWINHNINTRGNKSLLCLPKVKTEMFRKSVHYQEATIFNKLPRELKEETSIVVVLY